QFHATWRHRDHRLVTGRVPWTGHNAQVIGEFGLTVEELEARVHALEPVPDHPALTAYSLELRPLDMNDDAGEHGILTAVVEMEVRVDDQPHIRRAQAMCLQGSRDRTIDDAILTNQNLRAAAPGVHQDRTELRMQHGEAVHRPRILDHVEAAEIEPD